MPAVKLHRFTWNFSFAGAGVGAGLGAGAGVGAGAGAGFGAAYYLAKMAKNAAAPAPSASTCANCGKTSVSPVSGATQIKANHCLKEPNGGTGNITIANIPSYAEVDSPIYLEGLANVFEGSFVIRIMGCEGNEISKINAQTEAGEVGASNPYFVNISYNDSNIGTYAIIEAYDFSMMDGSVQNLIQVPVYLK